MSATYRTLKGFTGTELTVLYQADGRRSTNKYPVGGYTVTYTEVTRENGQTHGTHPDGTRRFLGGAAAKFWVVTDGDPTEAPEAAPALTVVPAPAVVPAEPEPVQELAEPDIMVRLLRHANETWWGTYLTMWTSLGTFQEREEAAQRAVDCGFATLDKIKLKITPLGRDYLALVAKYVR